MQNFLLVASFLAKHPFTVDFNMQGKESVGGGGEDFPIQAQDRTVLTAEGEAQIPSIDSHVARHAPRRVARRYIGPASLRHDAVSDRKMGWEMAATWASGSAK